MRFVSDKELDRKYRVLKQSLSIHTRLRDKLKNRALFIDLLLIAGGILFVATVFAGDEVYIFLNLSPHSARFILKVSSVIVFLISLIAMIVDWKSISSHHNQAAQKMTDLMTLFRESHNDKGEWNEENINRLNNSYWEVNRNIIEIPEKQFNRLKAHHIGKVSLSKMIDLAPGVPVFILRVVLFGRSIKRIIKNRSGNDNDQ